MSVPAETFKITVAAFHALLGAQARKQITPELVRATDARWREVRATSPHAARMYLSENDEPPLKDPWQEVVVRLDGNGRLRRVDETPLDQRVAARLESINSAVLRALKSYPNEVERITTLLGEWMTDERIVHVIGAGRALLAASLPANRLAHGGANVYILGDKAPPPNSRFGGGIIAASASGETRSVLEIMTFAQDVNRLRPPDQQITVIGVSNPAAKAVKPFKPFADLCTPGCFVGIQIDEAVELRGLGDLEELAIEHLLDALVVAAGAQIGVNFRMGHEDLVGGATGPWHQHSQPA